MLYLLAKLPSPALGVLAFQVVNVATSPPGSQPEPTRGVDRVQPTRTVNHCHLCSSLPGYFSSSFYREYNRVLKLLLWLAREVHGALLFAGD